jgi:hypothetical protein
MFFTITPTDISTLTGYIAGMIGDFMPLLLVVIGVSVGMFIFNKIFK